MVIFNEVISKFTFNRVMFILNLFMVLIRKSYFLPVLLLK